MNDVLFSVFFFTLAGIIVLNVVVFVLLGVVLVTTGTNTIDLETRKQLFEAWLYFVCGSFVIICAVGSVGSIVGILTAPKCPNCGKRKLATESHTVEDTQNEGGTVTNKVERCRSCGFVVSDSWS